MLAIIQLIQIVQLVQKFAKRRRPWNTAARAENICDEIADEYEKYILLGALRPGEKLPSCRALAGQLGINPNTVERAFTLLEERGLIYTLPKKGAFVCEHLRPDLLARKEAETHLAAMKRAGLTLEEVISLAKQVFGEEKK